MLLLSFLFLWEILLIDYSISINLHVTLESLKLGLQTIKLGTQILSICYTSMTICFLR